MAFTEDDMRQAVNLATDLSAENRRLKRSVAYHRELIRIASKMSLDLVDAIDRQELIEARESAGLRRRIANVVLCSRMPKNAETSQLLERCARR